MTSGTFPTLSPTRFRHIQTITVLDARRLMEAAGREAPVRGFDPPGDVMQALMVMIESPTTEHAEAGFEVVTDSWEALR